MYLGMATWATGELSMSLLEKVATSNLPRFPSHDAVAQLAYSYWSQSGGSSKSNWYRALAAIRQYYIGRDMDVVTF